jgi:hypothetical protein
VFQIVDFSSVNDLKFTYVHFQFPIFFRGYNPLTPIIKGRRGEGKREEGRGGEGRGGEGRGWDGGEPPENKSCLRPWLNITLSLFHFKESFKKSAPIITREPLID